MAGSFL
jgi:hypothetical protein